MVRRSLTARPFERHVLAHDELEASAQRSLDTGLIDLSVSLGGVSVAGLEECSGHVDRDEQRGARHHLLVVDVARVNPGRHAAPPARVRRRRHAHAAEERCERNGDPRQELRGILVAVEPDDLHAHPLTQIADVAAAAVVPVRERHLDAQDAHLEHVTRLGSFHIDRSGEDVPARTPLRHLIVHGAQRGLDFVGRYAGAFQPGRARCQEGRHLDDVS